MRPKVRTRNSKFKKPPIIESVFRMKWKKSVNSYPLVDFRYHKIPTGLYSLLESEYPYVEKEDPTGEVYWFRKTEEGFPLIQIDPESMSIHMDETNYIEKIKFLEVCGAILKKFFGAFDFVVPVQLSLSYLDAFDLQEGENISNFLKEKLHTTFSFNSIIHEHVNREQEVIRERDVIGRKPVSIRFRNEYRVNEPEGLFTCLISAPHPYKDRNVLLLDTSITSGSKDTDIGIFSYSREGEESILKNLFDWLNKAEALVYDWFFAMVTRYDILFENEE